jgi:hypothetical protein
LKLNNEDTLGFQRLKIYLSVSVFCAKYVYLILGNTAKYALRLRNKVSFV